MIFSIIITSYNYDEYLNDCIQSCLNQSSLYPYEIIIIDDGSSDNSISILNKIRNEKVKVFFKKNSGIEKASNYGFKKSIGKYILRLDADDYLHKDFLKIMSEKLDENVDFFYSNTVIDSKSKEINKSELPIFNKNEILERGDFSIRYNL